MANLAVLGLAGFSGGIVLPTTIGDEFQGGYYMGQLGGYYLICAPIAGQYDGTLQWKTTNTTTANTDSTTDGHANTAAMVVAGIAAHPAGRFCVDLTIDGYSDWYLPSKNELNLLYTNHAALEAAGAGSFGVNYFWSSSEYNASGAWDQYFGNGSQGVGNKSTSYYVRAIRRFVYESNFRDA